MMISLYPERLLPGSENWDVGLSDHMQRYRFASDLCVGKTVIDAACGVGYGSSLLANAGALFVHAVDLSDDTIAVAREQFAHPNVEFLVDNCETLDSIQDKVNVIVGLECFEHFANPNKFLSRCTELLDVDGLIVLSTPNAKALGRSNYGRPINPFHVHEYTLQELKTILGEYFGEVVIYYQMKSRLLELYEDTRRFVNFSYRMNPMLRLFLWIRRVLKRPGLDPVLRPFILSEKDFEICANVQDPDRAWVFIAVCRKPLK